MKDTTIGIGVCVVVVILFLGLSGTFSSDNGQPQEQSANANQQQVQDNGQPDLPSFSDPAADAQTAAGVTKKDTVVGTGVLIAPGDVVSVFYTGKLSDGTVFDSNVGKEVLQFVYGQEGFIKGWNAGFIGMKEGGKRTVTIPSSLGYGANQVGPIPPNSALVFDVELVKVEKAQ